MRRKAIPEDEQRAIEDLAVYRCLVFSMPWRAEVRAMPLAVRLQDDRVKWALKYFFKVLVMHSIRYKDAQRSTMQFRDEWLGDR